MALIDLIRHVAEINEELGNRGRIELTCLPNDDRLVIRSIDRHGGDDELPVKFDDSIIGAIERMAEALGPPIPVKDQEACQNGNAQTFDAWKSWIRQRGPTATPMRDERAAVLWEATNKYGSANNWTGTTGTLAKGIRELLIDREVLRMRLEAREGGK